MPREVLSWIGMPKLEMHEKRQKVVHPLCPAPQDCCCSWLQLAVDVLR